MGDVSKLNRLLGITVAVILLTSFTALAYTHIPKGDRDVLVINGLDFPWDNIFNEYPLHNFTATGNDYVGVSIKDLVLDAGISNPETHNYRLIGIDGYQKDVSWNDIQNGYLVQENHRAVFPGLTQSFWVRDLVNIEVM